jgi:hypothetical protein
MEAIPISDFTRAVLILLGEAYMGPDEQHGIWFVDSTPNVGFFGTLEEGGYLPHSLRGLLPKGAPPLQHT